ncbi:hypothetical protein Taro_017963 [Colocasia esculenta]|uniref:Uncharacterized protein n=1 Tax=Colocasia esculenta TaxID=4460 RepID=A0A843UQ42_COLES|nr:hypothetical protein [Colocasia esculenta]
MAATTWSRHPRASRHGRDRQGHRDMVVRARGVATRSRLLGGVATTSETGTPRTTGVLPGADQSVIFLTGSLFVALEPPREVRRGTVVQPDYDSHCCVTLCSFPHSDEMWRFGPGSRIRRETSQQWQGARRVDEAGR